MSEANKAIIDGLKSAANRVEEVKNAEAQFYKDCRNWLVELSREAKGSLIVRFLLKYIYPKWIIAMILIMMTIKHPKHEIHSKYTLGKRIYEGNYTVFKVQKKGQSDTFNVRVLTQYLNKAI